MVSNMENKSLKRKLEAVSEVVMKKKKKNNKQKEIPPPTIEEMNRLRETENVFHSNLFRLQIEEMLKEIKMKPKVTENLKIVIEAVKKIIMNSPTKSFKIADLQCPVKYKSNFECFNFIKPSSVEICGSFQNDCTFRNNGSVDLCVRMPKELFDKEDYLNEKYLKKRTYYLAVIAKRLIKKNNQESPLYSRVEYVILNDSDKPVLRLTLSNDKLEKYPIVVRVFPENEVLKESRLLPSTNNIRYKWFFDVDKSGDVQYPTPFYNAILAHEMVSLKNDELRRELFEQNPSLKEAYLLLKVWLQQRKLDVGLGSFNGFLLAMFMVYLRNNRKINNQMSNYQVMRIVWLNFDQINMNKDGISLNGTPTEKFIGHYDVVFVDVTGTANLTANVYLSTYLNLQKESKQAIEMLDDVKCNNFKALFLVQLESHLKFDNIIRFDKESLVDEVVNQNLDLRMKLDYRDDKVSQFVTLIYKVLNKALGKRIADLHFSFEPAQLCWSVNEEIPSYKHVVLGLNFDPEFYLNTFDRGPVANLPEAEDFRRFWGSKSQIRRYRDGETCEAVVWAASNDPMQKKRLIVREIVHHILQERLRIEPNRYTYLADQMENAVFQQYNETFVTSGTGEESCLNIINSFDQLSQDLKDLSTRLPLTITSVEGSSPAFCYSVMYPTLPNIRAIPKKSITFSDEDYVAKFNLELAKVPLYTSPIEGVIQLASSNKWPRDLGAIRRLQAAFYNKLGSELKSTGAEYVCQVYHDFIDILKGGYVFRLKLANTHEITAVRQQTNDIGEVDYVDNEESSMLEKTLIHGPHFISAIHGLHLRYPIFGPTSAMVKRWMRCQLIDEYYMPDVCIDLILSYMCLYPQPYTPAHNTQELFWRFLKFISTDNWFAEPLIINFEDAFIREHILELESALARNRDNLPPLVLVTPFEKTGIIWTRENPSLTILRRLSILANASLRVMDSAIPQNDHETLLQIFCPPVKGYAIMIKINKEVNSTSWYSLHGSRQMAAVKHQKFDKIPILNFHPVRQYVNELRKHYEEYCLFFYNSWGGNFIGVVIKPDVLTPKTFKIANMVCAKADNANLVFDIDAAIDDFRIMGEGLVTSVVKC